EHVPTAAHRTGRRPEAIRSPVDPRPAKVHPRDRSADRQAFRRRSSSLPGRPAALSQLAGVTPGDREGQPAGQTTGGADGPDQNADLQVSPPQGEQSLLDAVRRGGGKYSRRAGGHLQDLAGADAPAAAGDRKLTRKPPAKVEA